MILVYSAIVLGLLFVGWIALAIYHVGKDIDNAIIEHESLPNNVVRLPLRPYDWQTDGE